MGKPGHPTGGGAYGRESVKKLEYEPESQDEHSRHRHYPDEEPKEYQSQDSRPRKSDHVSAQNSSNGAGCPYHRDPGIGRGKNVQKAGCQSTQNVKDEKLCMTKLIFNVVSKDPEIKHVTCQMEKPSM